MNAKPTAPPRGTSLYDYCQGVINGAYAVKPDVEKSIEAGEFVDAADWASQRLTEWHPTKNGDLTPRDVAASTDKMVWRQKNCHGVLHEWEAQVRTIANGIGCSVCSGRTVQQGVNDLATLNPALAAEWHPTKNGDLTPQQVTARTNKKVWWRKNCDGTLHEWKATTANRAIWDGCSVCHGKTVQQGVNDLATLNPALAAEWHPTKNGDLTPQQVTARTNKKVWWKKECVAGSLSHEWQATVENRSHGFGCSVCHGKTVQQGVNDLATLNPALAAEWHPTKNGDLTPQQVASRSRKKVWWKKECVAGGLSHEWQATIGERYAGNGCAVCHGKQVHKGVNDLATVNPAIAAEWHPTKNGDLTPDQFTAASNKTAWWVCNCGYEWKAQILGRYQGYGCSSCAVSGYDPSKTGFLYVVYHDALGAWKVGIANNLERRLKQHRLSGFAVDEAATVENTGDFIQRLETEILHLIFKTNGAVSLKDAGNDQFASSGYTETWLASSFTPSGIVNGDCQAMLDWMIATQRDLDWAT